MKTDSVILLGFECTINPRNLIKIVGAIFEKIKIFIFFLCELTLVLGVGGERKNSWRYLQEDPRYRFERDRSIGLGSTIVDGQTDRHTHTFLDCGSDVE